MKCVLAFLTMLVLGTTLADAAHAESLRIQPLDYQTTLRAGERQKGFVDITNPTGRAVEVNISAQAFRQINDKGDLQFYNSPEVAAGIIPDYTDFELGPRQTIHLFFVVDGTKLPSGDVFAALFATTKPQTQNGVTQAIRVGTLLSIVNGTPGSRTAVITTLKVAFFQFSDRVNGSYVIKNMADPTQTTGFYPSVALTLNPFTVQQKTTDSLIYAGRARTNTFTIQTARLGFYKVTAQYGSSSQSRWVFMVTGIWRWLAPSSILAILLVILLWRKKYHRTHRRLSHSV